MTPHQSCTTIITRFSFWLRFATLPFSRWTTILLVALIGIGTCPKSAQSLSFSSVNNKSNNNSKLSDDQLKVRLMTYNIHGWRDSHHHCNFERVVDVINQVKPDILCLNEVLHPFARPPIDSNSCKNSRLSKEEKQQQYYYDAVKSGKARGVDIDPSFVPSDESQTFLNLLSQRTRLTHMDFKGATNNCFFGKGVSFGNAVLSRFPIARSEHFLLETEDGDLCLGNQERSFVDPRAFSFAKVSLPDDMNIGVCYTHLDHKSEELREKQIQKGLGAFDNRNMSLIVCGDLNTFQKSDYSSDDWNAILDLYKRNKWPAPPEHSLALKSLRTAGFRDAFYNIKDNSEGKKHPKPTCWTQNPIMRIDHIWISDGDEISSCNMGVICYERFESNASDHFPVWVDLEISLSEQ